LLGELDSRRSDAGRELLESALQTGDYRYARRIADLLDRILPSKPGERHLAEVWNRLLARAEQAAAEHDYAAAQDALARALVLSGPSDDVELVLLPILAKLTRSNAWDHAIALVSGLERAVPKSGVGEAGFERLLEWALRPPVVQVDIARRIAEECDGLSGRGSALLKQELRECLGRVLRLLQAGKAEEAVHRLIELAPLLCHEDESWAQFCIDAAGTLDRAQREAVRLPLRNEYNRAAANASLRRLLKQLADELGVSLE
jgi:hypothetical protein